MFNNISGHSPINMLSIYKQSHEKGINKTMGNIEHDRNANINTDNKIESEQNKYKKAVGEYISITNNAEKGRIEVERISENKENKYNQITNEQKQELSRESQIAKVIHNGNPLSHLSSHDQALMIANNNFIK